MDNKQSISNRDINQSPPENEVFLESIIDTIRESLIVLDKDLNIQTANKTFYKSFKVKPEETLHKKIYDLGNGQWNIPQLKKLLEEILPKHNPFNNFQVEHDFPGIGKKDMLLNARQIKERGRWKDSILLAIEDVTTITKAQRQAKTADEQQAVSLKRAQQSEALLRAIIEATPECIKIVNPDGTLEFMNSSGLNMIEGAPNLLGKACVYEVIDPKYKKEWIKNHKRVCKGKSLNWEFDIIGLHGTRRRMETHAVPLHNPDGTISQLAVTRDITDKYKYQEELEESVSRFRTLADNIPNLCWMADEKGNIFWYNSRWYEYTGKTEKEMLGWGWQSVHDPEVLPKVMKRWKESIGTGKSFEMVFPLKGKDDKFRSFLTRIVPIKDSSNKIVQWFGTNTDIERQKELEKQKDNFLGIASHELKTPVTSIKAYGQVLQTIFKRKGDMKAVEQLVKMDAQINKLTNLIGDLLDVTKIQSGKLQFNEEYFDFNALVEEITSDLQLTTEKHTIERKLGKTCEVYGDRERIGQVITNLVANAIKYSPHSQKIIVETSHKKSEILVCVQDFGIGIPEDKQAKLFQQFYRVSDANQSSFPGLGLGLYISSEIVKRQGGKIWVESIEGKGSTFCFSLPVLKSK